MSEESATVILPLPSIHLHPNKQPGTRGGRMRKHRVAKAYRKAACEAMAAVGIESTPWPAARVRARFYFKTKRRRDGDNLNAWIKAGLDGIADAGIVGDDSDFTVEPPAWAVDDACPRVEVEIERAG